MRDLLRLTSGSPSRERRTMATPRREIKGDQKHHSSSCFDSDFKLFKTHVKPFVKWGSGTDVLHEDQPTKSLLSSAATVTSASELRKRGGRNKLAQRHYAARCSLN